MDTNLHTKAEQLALLLATMDSNSSYADRTTVIESTFLDITQALLTDMEG